MKNTILYVDDEEENLKGFRFAFLNQFNILLAQNTQKAEELLNENEVKVLITDQRMPNENGTEFIERIRFHFPNLVCIILTGYSDLEVVVDAINSGNIYRYLSKPLDENEMRYAINQAIEKYDLSSQNKNLVEELQRKNKNLLDKILQMERTHDALFRSKTELNLRKQELEKTTKNLEESNHNLKKVISESEKKQILLKKIADSYPNAYISVIEKDYTVSFTGGSEFKKLGLDPESYNGQTIDNVFGPAANFIKTKYSKAFQKEVITFELFFRDQYQLYKVVPIIENDGRVHRILAVVENISKQKKAEKELRAAKEKAEESNRLKTQFINNLSHEVRTPMNGIVGFANLLAKPDLTPEVIKSYTQVIESSSNKLLRSVNDILEISRLETEEIVLKNRLINLKDLFSNLYSLYSLKAQEKNLNLKIDLPQNEDVAHHVYTDNKALAKILHVLLDNAIKFTHKGYIEYGYKVNNNTATFYVKDTGIGIPKDKFDFIFERFFQSEDTFSKKYSGLGLGLSIAKKYIELVGSKLQVESEEDKGSSFSFSLDALVRESIKKDTPDQNITTRNKKKEFSILIAEDEDINYLYLTTSFEEIKHLEFKTYRAENGKIAIERVNNIPDLDLILMDIRMPVMDGFEATTAIKKRRPNIKIIAQSAFCTEDDQQKALAAGCDGFISKPISSTTLLALINEFLIKEDKSSLQNFWVIE